MCSPIIANSFEKYWDLKDYLDLELLVRVLGHEPQFGGHETTGSEEIWETDDVAGFVPDSIHNWDTGVYITGTLEIDDVTVEAVAWSFDCPMLIVW